MADAEYRQETELCSALYSHLLTHFLCRHFVVEPDSEQLIMHSVCSGGEGGKDSIIWNNSEQFSWS
jgi:hypothetical protein